MSKSDISLFIYRHHTVIIYFLVYVDDVIVIGSSIDTITQLVTTLGNDFPLKDLGTLQYILGIECRQSPIGLVLSQRKYILEHKSYYILRESSETPPRSSRSPLCGASGAGYFVH